MILLLFCFVIGKEVGLTFGNKITGKKNKRAIIGTDKAWLMIYIMMKKTFFLIMSRFYNKLAAGACSDFDHLLFSEIDDIVFFLH